MRRRLDRSASTSFALVGAAVSLVVAACTTDLGNIDQSSLGRSTVLGASTATVVRVLETEGTVVWFDSQAKLYSCPKTGCDGTPAVLTSATSVFSGSAAGSYGLDHLLPASIAAGFVYWSTGSNVYRCALSGCVAPQRVFSGRSDVVRMATDGTWVAWGDATAITLCNAADCQPRIATGSCGSDAECPAARPLCGPNGACVACVDNGTRKGTCDGATPTCGSDFTCVGCDDDAGVKACTAPGGSACDPHTRSCVRCLSAAQCAVGPSRFQTCIGQQCVPCDGEYGSGSANPCTADQPSCGGQGTCAACSPTSCAAGLKCGPHGCALPCATTSQCTATHFCEASLCAPRRPAGEACASASECLANVCLNGKCGKASGDTCANDADCAAGVCGVDKQCGAVDGGSCSVASQCRSGACAAHVCGNALQAFGTTLPVPATLVVAGGRLFYSQLVFGATSTSSVVSCDAGACPAGTAPVFPPRGGTSAILLAGDAQSLFYVEAVDQASSGELFRCELPGCATPTDMNIRAGAPTQIVGDDLFVYDERLPGLVHCSRSGCGSDVPAPLPDPGLVESNRGAETLGAHPFAVDPSATYWATSRIFGISGNLVVSTPR